jgi:hypothetical protein
MPSSVAISYLGQIIPIVSTSGRGQSRSMASNQQHPAGAEIARDPSAALTRSAGTGNHSTKENPVKRTINFDRDGVALVGDLFTPAGFDESGNYPAVIVQGSFTSVKEQMAGTYAEKFAEQGFVTLTFDYSHYGQSEGLPRQFESPAEKLADLQAAVTYLLDLPYVDAVGMVGVCTSASALSGCNSASLPVDVPGELHTHQRNSVASPSSRCLATARRRAGPVVIASMVTRSLPAPHSTADEFAAPDRSKLVTPWERTPLCRSFSSTSSPPSTVTHQEKDGPGSGASRARSTSHGSASSPSPPT